VKRTFDPVFWTLAQVGHRLKVGAPPGHDKGLQPIATGRLDAPTRHGTVRLLIYTPLTASFPLPIVIHLHGGGFVNRYPEQDAHIARRLCSDLGAVLILPDYDTGPKVQFPIAEEEAFDVFRWAQENAPAKGWDKSRLAVTGVSAGAKLAINICQQSHWQSLTGPSAVALVVPVTDVFRTDRRSSAAKASISPFVQRFVEWSYFPDAATRRSALASPRYDPSVAAAMPPTLILVGELDTLADEGKEFAAVLQAAGVTAVLRTFTGSDHDFIMNRKSPANRFVAIEALRVHLEHHL
jgi:acetyl esterase